MEHSSIGASGAHRWMVCPGSVELIKKAPPQRQSDVADEGTDAHELSHLCLESGKSPTDYIGKRMSKGFEVTDEMCEAVSVYIDTVHSFAQTGEGKFIHLHEVKFDLSFIHLGLFGTADTVLISSDLKQLVVIDYKHGKGVPVEAVDNKQLLFYGLGAVAFCHKRGLLDEPTLFGWHQSLEEIELVIVQPRCGHKEGPVRSWGIMSPAFDDFATELYDAAVKTEAKDAELLAGDHCKWCPAQAICPALGKEIDEVAANSFSVIKSGGTPQLPIATELSIDQVTKICQKSDLITDWIKAVKVYAEDLALGGEVIPGFKLVNREGHRKWVDENEVVAKLSLIVDEDKLYDMKVKSPSQIEKLIGKKQKDLLYGLWTKPNLGPALVPEHDKREAIVPALGFEKLES